MECWYSAWQSRRNSRDVKAKRKIDICCVQVRWRGASVRTVTEKIASTNSSGLVKKTGNGGVGVFVTKKWIDKVLEVKRVSDRLMMIKLKTDKGTVVVVSTLKIISM